MKATLSTQGLINKAKEGFIISHDDGSTSRAHRSSVDTLEGSIICEIEKAQSRTSFYGWGRTVFYIVKPGEKYRSRYSKSKALNVLG